MREIEGNGEICHKKTPVLCACARVWRDWHRAPFGEKGVFATKKDGGPRSPDRSRKREN